MTRRPSPFFYRIVEWTDAGTQYEADPRHVDLIIEEMGLESANGTDVTGSKVDIKETDAELEHEEAYRYRSIVARLYFLAADRADTQFASKEICRRMSSPCMSDWAHAGEILAEAPQTWQGVESNLQVYVDTDYVGCPHTRGSTNGGLVMHGSHLLKTLATTQSVVALSSGDAESFGVVKGMCEEALGDQDSEGHGPCPQHHFVHRFFGGEGDRYQEGLGEGQHTWRPVGPGQDR